MLSLSTNLFVVFWVHLTHSLSPSSHLLIFTPTHSDLGQVENWKLINHTRTQELKIKRTSYLALRLALNLIYLNHPITYKSTHTSHL